jgi:hypothetical protein
VYGGGKLSSDLPNGLALGQAGGRAVDVIAGTEQ